MSSSEGARVHVQVGGDDTTEVFVIDSSLRLRERGFAPLSVDLEPGLYKLKFRSGPTTREQVVEVAPGSPPVQVAQPDLPVPTAVPLASSRGFSPEGGALAEAQSRAPVARCGDGAEMFFFVQGPGRPPEQADDPQHSLATGLSLGSLEGEQLVDLEAQGTWGALSGGGAWAACAVRLDPGPYRLRLETRSWGALEQTLVATRGWQTQVFLGQADYSQAGDQGLALAEPEHRPDLANASVLLARLGAGFSCADPDLRLVEQARAALASRRGLGAEAWRRLLRRESQNPMLALYAAHVVLTSRQRERSEPAPDESPKDLDQILSFLVGELGLEHPDVGVLSAHLGGSGAPAVFDVPPMLRASWELLAGRGVSTSVEVAAPTSLLARVAPHVWGSSVWLQWLGDRVESADEAAAAAMQAADGFERLQSFTVTNRERWKRMQADFSSLQAAILRNLRRGAMPSSTFLAFGARDGGPGRAELDSLPPAARDLDELAQRLRLPAATIRSAVGELGAKLRDDLGGGLDDIAASENGGPERGSPFGGSGPISL